MEKAEAWLERATDAARSRAPLKKLREVLHAGVRLGADVPQVWRIEVLSRIKPLQQERSYLQGVGPSDVGRPGFDVP